MYTGSKSYFSEALQYASGAVHAITTDDHSCRTSDRAIFAVDSSAQENFNLLQHFMNRFAGSFFLHFT